jgi:hypothetical protein
MNGGLNGPFVNEVLSQSRHPEVAKRLARGDCIGLKTNWSAQVTTQIE